LEESGVTNRQRNAKGTISGEKGRQSENQQWGDSQRKHAGKSSTAPVPFEFQPHQKEQLPPS
jgi:hypothetical protein